MDHETLKDLKNEVCSPRFEVEENWLIKDLNSELCSAKADIDPNPAINDTVRPLDCVAPRPREPDNDLK